MAKKEPPKDQDKKPRVNPEDLEKTTIALDIRNLEDMKEKYSEAFEETVMVRAPQKEETSLSDFFEEEEKTGDHPTAAPQPKVSQAKSSGKKPPKKPDIKPPPQPAARYDARNESSYTIMPRMAELRPKLSLPFLGLSLFIFLILAAGLVEALTRGPGLRLPAILATGLGALALGAMLFRRMEGRVGFLWIAVAWFGLVAYSGIYFLTSDSESLHFAGASLGTLMAVILGAIGLIIALTLVQKRRVPLLSKILAGVGLLILLVASVISLIQGQPMEDSLWGPGFLNNLPPYLRPGVLALAISFPLFALAVLIALILVKESTRGKFRTIGIPLLLLSLLGILLGTKLLVRQGIEVPIVGRLFPETYSGLTLLDPSSSAVRLQIGDPGKSDAFYLETAASRSRLKGNTREARLMVRNLEGRDLAADLSPWLTLSRGDKNLKGVKVELQRSLLGEGHNIGIILDLPSLANPEVKAAMAAALYRLADQMRGSDQLWISSAAGQQSFSSSDRGAWESQINKVLVPGSAEVGQLFSSVLKKLAGEAGIRQLIYVGDAASLPPASLRQSWKSEADKNKAALSVVALGPGNLEGDGLYQAQDATALGFELLSASAESLGQYQLFFPNLPPLPKISLVRDQSGQVSMAGGKIDFSILAPDPSAIRSLQLQVDQDKPIELGTAQLNQSVDLMKIKIKPGTHRFALLLTTTSSDTVSEIFQTSVVTRKPLRFVKPLDKDTIAGVTNVSFSPGRVQGLEIGSVDLLLDGVKTGGATAEPYLIPVNTAALSEGEHTFQAIQTFSDGSTETAQLQVRVNQQVPQVKLVRPSPGEYLSNLAELEAQIGGGLFEQVQKVEFFVDGEWVGESLQAPYRFLWANNTFPSGKYFVQAKALLNSQATTTDAVEIQLGHGEVVVQADASVSPSGMLYPENVEALLDASAGMNEPIGQAIKLDLAKYALSELLQGLPGNVKFGTRVFGGQKDSSQKNCTDSTLLKKPASQLGALQARGTRPLAYNLKLLGQDLKKASGSRVAFLITDGWELCGEDPLEVASQLAKQSEKLRLNILYFSDIDPSSESLLKKLAEVMGGRAFKISRSADLGDALREAMQVSFTLFDFKNAEVASQPLSANPLSLRSGEYRLEIGTAPAMSKQNVVIPTGGRKTFTIVSENGGYQLKEE